LGYLAAGTAGQGASIQNLKRVTARNARAARTQCSSTQVGPQHGALRCKCHRIFDFTRRAVPSRQPKLTEVPMPNRNACVSRYPDKRGELRRPIYPQVAGAICGCGSFQTAVGCDVTHRDFRSLSRGADPRACLIALTTTTFASSSTPGRSAGRLGRGSAR
jgi:hypothetical protein